jgi:hypothetical protein
MVLAGDGLPESCPQNGDMPKSPFSSQAALMSSADNF